jgi:hypothetical protein
MAGQESSPVTWILMKTLKWVLFPFLCGMLGFLGNHFFFDAFSSRVIGALSMFIPIDMSPAQMGMQGYLGAVIGISITQLFKLGYKTGRGSEYQEGEWQA